MSRPTPFSRWSAICRARRADLGIRRIGLLAPYVPSISRAVVRQLEAAGLEVGHVATFDEQDDSRVARLSASAVLEALVALGERDDCDAVFGSCTNLRGLGLLDEAARRTGKPVLTSNSALAWHVERLVDRVGDV